MGWSGAPLAALVSVVVAGLSWLVWLAVDGTGIRHPALSAASATMAAAGGVLASSGHADLVFAKTGSRDRPQAILHAQRHGRAG